ncbi:MAG: 50S ribosomal protein L28 [Chloroflexi bacterium]|nr:50S ribosomal protein L28 [Chloroflexota bacterium]
MCQVCGKSRMYGFNVSHSKRHTKRSWQANTHRTTITVDGRQVRVNICTRCLRTLNKAKV